MHARPAPPRSSDGATGIQGNVRQGPTGARPFTAFVGEVGASLYCAGCRDWHEPESFRDTEVTARRWERICIRFKGPVQQAEARRGASIVPKQEAIDRRWASRLEQWRKDIINDCADPVKAEKQVRTWLRRNGQPDCDSKADKRPAAAAASLQLNGELIDASWRLQQTERVIGNKSVSPRFMSSRAAWLRGVEAARDDAGQMYEAKELEACARDLLRAALTLVNAITDEGTRALSDLGIDVRRHRAELRAVADKLINTSLNKTPSGALPAVIAMVQAFDPANIHRKRCARRARRLERASTHHALASLTASHATPQGARAGEAPAHGGTRRQRRGDGVGGGARVVQEDARQHPSPEQAAR